MHSHHKKDAACGGTHTLSNLNPRDRLRLFGAVSRQAH
jgi:hypothetical protein